MEVEKKAYLTRSEVALRRAKMDQDVWLFIRLATEHGGGYVERFHRPLAYFLRGDALRLAACLNDQRFDSEFTTQVRAWFAARGIDWNTRKGIAAMSRALRRINNRLSRATAKTHTGMDVILAATSADPNLSVGIASKSDPNAQDKMCTSIGKLMLTDAYALYYSDRLFTKNPEAFITKKWIRMNGRGASDQESIEARGINSQWTGNHYDWIYADDIVGTESGEASTEDAIRWISALHGISKPDGLGGSRHIFNGTIYGPNDDNAKLSSNPDFVSIRVPIWKREAPATLSNLADDGVPVLPEWYGIEAVREMRRDTLANDTLGAISWLQNFELTAHEAGAMQFSAELLRRSKFVWITRPITVGSTTIEKRFMRRYLWTADKKPKLDTKRKAGRGDCFCWQACGLANHEYVEFDPMSLTRVLGVDQALSFKSTADKWAIAVVAQDPHGFLYKLKGASDRGYDKMVAAIPYVYKKWGGSQNPPRKVGIESNAWQAITANWLQRDDTFRFLARRIVKVSPGQVQKELRIFNQVLANLEMGMLLTDPEDTEFDAEALKYNPGSQKNPDDGELDACGIAITTLGQPAEDYDEISESRDARKAEAEYWKDIDTATGVDVSSDWMDAVSW